MQNHDGGFASFELIRGSKFLEVVNPAEVFGMMVLTYGPYHALTFYITLQFVGDIMIEHSYPECTTSVVTALSTFKKYYPDYRREDIMYPQISDSYIESTLADAISL